MATRDEIKKVIGYIKLAFPNYAPVVEGEVNSVDVFTDLLGDVDADLLWLAVKSCCTESKRAFAPSAGEIRGAALELTAQACGIPSAGEAWAEIVASFERMPGGNMAGGGHSPVLDHPVVVEAVREMGGYTALGVDYFDNLMANRAHFLRIYPDVLGRWKRDAGQLPAVAEYVRRLGTGSVAGMLMNVSEVEKG